MKWLEYSMLFRVNLSVNLRDTQVRSLSDQKVDTITPSQKGLGYEMGGSLMLGFSHLIQSSSLKSTVQRFKL